VDPHRAPQRRELEVKRTHPSSAVNPSSLRSASITFAAHSCGLGSASITRPGTLHIAPTADLTLATSQSPWDPLVRRRSLPATRPRTAPLLRAHRSKRGPYDSDSRRGGNGHTSLGLKLSTRHRVANRLACHPPSGGGLILRALKASSGRAQSGRNPVLAARRNGEGECRRRAASHRTPRCDAPRTQAIG
jgi:hypothetical protein